MSRLVDAAKKLVFSVIFGNCPSCKANLSSIKDQKLLMTVLQCPSCRIGLKPKKDSLIENVIFYSIFLSLAISIVVFQINNLYLFPFAIAGLVYTFVKRQKWRAVTQGEMCPQCYYDLYGLTNPTSCPECGKQLNQSER